MKIDFLRTLHSLQPGPEVSSLPPREDERMVAEEYFVRAQREIAPKLRHLVSFQRVVLTGL